MKHRACRALLCLVLVGSLLLSMTVEALADLTTIGTDASRPEYFEALGASGNYNPLKTPYHYDRTTGNVAYCLEHKKDSPSSSAEYTDFDASALWGQNTLTGIQAIVDHGYPNHDGGLTEEQAHYATANAIRTWMKESADVGFFPRAAGTCPSGQCAQRRRRDGARLPTGGHLGGGRRCIARVHRGHQLGRLCTQQP